MRQPCRLPWLLGLLRMVSRPKSHGTVQRSGSCTEHDRSRTPDRAGSLTGPERAGERARPRPNRAEARTLCPTNMRQTCRLPRLLGLLWSADRGATVPCNEAGSHGEHDRSRAPDRAGSLTGPERAGERARPCPTRDHANSGSGSPHALPHEHEANTQAPAAARAAKDGQQTEEPRYHATKRDRATNTTDPARPTALAP